MGDESNTAGEFRKRFAYNFNAALDRCGVKGSGYGRVKAVATLFGISTTSAHKWLSGSGLPETHKFPELACVLGCSLSNLFFGFGTDISSEDDLGSLVKLRVLTNSGERFSLVQREFLSAFGWGAELYSLQVDDDLMEPFVVHNEYVLFVPVTETEYLSGVYVLFLNGKYSVRRLQQLSDGAIRLICENHRFSPEDVPAHRISISSRETQPLVEIGRIAILGKVVGRLIAR